MHMDRKIERKVYENRKIDKEIDEEENLGESCKFQNWVCKFIIPPLLPLAKPDSWLSIQLAFYRKISNKVLYPFIHYRVF